MTQSISQVKIVYLDIDYILSNSNKGKLILSNLENLNKKNIEILKSKEDLLKKEETELVKQKNIISNEKFNEKVNNLKNKIKTFRIEKDKLVKNFNIDREKNINEFLKLVNQILNKYAEENSINLVLNKKDILMGKKSYNITSEILEIVNKEIK